MKELAFVVFFGLLCFVACEPITRYLSWEDENMFEETGEFLFEKQKPKPLPNPTSEND